MEQHISPDRIANSIMMDRRFRGHVLVEGAKDLKVYSKFFNREQVKLTQTFGKYRLRQAFSILTERNYMEKFAIRDADFLRVSGNIKFEENYQDDIYVKDGHDSEVMMVTVNSLEDMLSVALDIDALERLEEKLRQSFRSWLLTLAYQVGCLRLANKRNSLGLSFKPKTQDGNRIKFKKFISDENLTIDLDKMINVVWEYSKNRDVDVADRRTIKDKYEEIYRDDNPNLEVVNGHDIAEIICFLAIAGAKTKNEIFKHPDRVEEALALSFDRDKFRRTQLFGKIESWKDRNDFASLFSE